MNLMQQYSDFMQNPGKILSKMGIPQNVNDPESIIQYLMDSGKINQNQYNQARQMAQRFNNQNSMPR